MKRIFDMSNEKIQKRIDNNIKEFTELINKKTFAFTKYGMKLQAEKEHEQKAILLGAIYRDVYLIKGFNEARDTIIHLNDSFIEKVFNAYEKLWEEKNSEK